jgi:predicted nucleic acid-binding protein
LNVVCNISPLLLLAKIDQLELLTGLYDAVLVPKSVLNEIESKLDKATMAIRERVRNQAFKIREADPQALVTIPADLGSGEREAIALALETHAQLVILDDEQGRRIAREQSLAVTGTIGVIIEARERGMLKSVRHELDRLIESGLWLDERFYHRVLREYGE